MAKTESKLDQWLKLRDEALDEWRSNLKALKADLAKLNENATWLKQPQYQLVESAKARVERGTKTREASSGSKKHGQPITEEWLLKTLAKPGKTFKQLKAAAIADGMAKATKTLYKALEEHKGKITEAEGQKAAGKKGKAPTVYISK